MEKYLQTIKNNIEDDIAKIIKDYSSLNNVEIHSIKIDGKFNYVTKKLDLQIYADVRLSGQIFLGMSS